MSFHFTGAGRSRAPVTLGGTSTSSADPASSARAQRLEREQHRQRQLASVRIQSQARRILVSKHTRSQWRTDSAHLLTQAQANLAATAAAPPTADLIHATRTLLVSLGPITRALDSTDVQLFLQWIKLVSHPVDGTPLVFHPFHHHSQDAASSWIPLLKLASKHSLRFLTVSASSRLTEAIASPTSLDLDLEILAFLGLLTGVDARSPAHSINIDTQQTNLASALLALLLDLGLHRTLRTHILSFTARQKSKASSLSPAVSLALAPLHRFKPASVPPSTASGVNAANAIDIDGASSSDAEAADIATQAIHSFAVEILTIPALRKRLPLDSVTELAKHLPFTSVLDWILRFKPPSVQAPQLDATIPSSTVEAQAAQALEQPCLLSNMLAFGSQRVAFFKDGATHAKYLRAITSAQDWLPASAFDPSTKSSASAADGHLLKTPQQRAAVEPGLSDAKETYERLRILVSDQHLSDVLALSNRFPAATRGPFFSFMCATLAAWPIDVHDHVLNRILYSGTDTSVARDNKQQRHNGPTGTAIIREVWRGYVRGSSLARSLASAHNDTRAREILASLSSTSTSEDWPALVLVFELLSNVLLTLGDDEFYPSDNQFGGSNAANAAWLSRDEIVSISGLLRNVAFAMYWYEGKAPLVNLHDEDLTDARPHKRTPRVPGMRMTLLSLRSLVTKVLKQLHLRDSRRRFAPADHWLMVSHLDLNDFMRTVVLEEQQLSSEQHDESEQFGGISPSNADSSTSSSHIAAVAQDADADMRVGEDSDYGMDEDDDAQSRQPLSRLQQLRARGDTRSRHLTALNLAFLSPRLGILNNVPFMIPFDVRTQIFRQFVQIDAVKNGIFADRWQRRRAVKIRRSHVAQDGFAALAPLGAEIKKPLEIVFVDQFGNNEAGIDGGGLFKEFLTSLVREAFDTNRGLWKATGAQELYPNPHTYATSGDQLEWYGFLGRVIGKALYEGILVDAKFAGFFLSKMLGKQSFLDDLGSIDSLDKELYKGLISLKNYQGNVEELALNFTVTDEEFGVSLTRELVPGGANIPVTNLNRMEYIYRISHYRLSTQIQHQCAAFFTGLADIINPRWLRNFNHEELSILISGSDDPVDIDDLRKHTVLGGYHEKDLTVEHFWHVLEGFDQPMRKAFLKFVTSSPKPPLLGFSQLNPMFAIRKAGDDTSRLPTASTCVNMLKLPDYADEATCREKLLYAIQSEAGFDLS
ncbi:HECT-domain-containing protein [Moesziomyces antarcticus]|uniref:HECT-type E3 ubiquitin transferase n=1 Tax=Pseudozyma antarctica TaxID=84753 RepID=A0A5C3FGF6_PSEA2|nr:HECT-domain-containing protein [Moesziomyces antarcticus]GAK62249.1 HECT-domain-containing protein [Moesziomyces antarcticus]SPO42785.1 related to ubiquitin protein ligase e3 [Moesziomyces antarcticus]